MKILLRAAVAMAIIVLAFDSPAQPDGPDPAIVQRSAEGLASDDEGISRAEKDRLAPQGVEVSRILNALMFQDDPRVRKAALELAWARKDPGTLAPGLTRLLRDSNPGNRWNAAHLLGKTGEAARGEPAAELVRAMLDPSLRIQVPATWAVAALGEISRDALVETLREPSVLLAARAFDKLSGPGIVVQGGDACAVDALVWALHSSPEAPIRMQAARVMRRLRLLGTKEEAELTRAVLEDASAAVRAAAAAALAETPEERHTDIVRALREARHDADPEARAAIVEALKKLGAGEEDLK